MKLLLAEDDAILADALSAQLRRAGFDVEHAPNGAVAEYLLLKQNFDLAILEGLFYQAPGASYVDAAPAAPMDITPLILLGMAEGAGAGMEGLA